MPKLVVLEGPNRGAVLRVLPETCRLGRDAACEHALPDEGVSRFHAEIRLDAESGWQLADLESKNGTYLNGVRVVQRHPLSHGNELRLGATVFIFLDDDAERLPTNRTSATSRGNVGGEAPRKWCSSQRRQRRIAATSPPELSHQRFVVSL